MSSVTFHIAICTCARAHPISVAQERLGRLRSSLLCICDPISCDPISLRGGWFARWVVCAVGRLVVCGLRGWRFARLAICAVGGLRGWRFARLAVCAVGGLRGWRFARLAVCTVDGWRGWRYARWADCAVGGLRGWRFARFAVGGLRLAVCVWRFAFGGLRLAVCVWRFAFGGLRLAFGRLRLAVSGLQFAVGSLRLTIGGLRFAFDVVVYSWSFSVALKIPFHLLNAQCWPSSLHNMYTAAQQTITGSRCAHKKPLQARQLHHPSNLAECATICFHLVRPRVDNKSLRDGT